MVLLVRGGIVADAVLDLVAGAVLAVVSVTMAVRPSGRPGSARWLLLTAVALAGALTVVRSLVWSE